MAFYEYKQNNTGGSFNFDHMRGISVTVIIEADNYDEANGKAENIGLYFGGRGDCKCCGNRWYNQYGDGDTVPSHYGNPINDKVSVSIDWANGKNYAYIHYADGRMIGIKAREK